MATTATATHETPAHAQDVPSLHHQNSNSSVEGSFPDEKHLEEGGIKEGEDLGTYDDHDVTRPFPVDPDYVEETHQLTVRAVFVGCCLGAVVGSSNIYLGLKTGFTFGASLFGAIFGFAILKAISKALPESGILGKLFGGEFGPKENCTVQTAATAAGGMGIIYVSAIPAMYRLGLMSEFPQQDVGKLIALTFCAAFFGIFFVIPLRKYYIVHLKLTFPTPAATAYTIRSLHNGRKGAIAAKKKAVCLFWTLISTFCFKVATGYAPGVIYDWHIGWTLSRIGFTSMIKLDNYGWWIEFTPAFFGAGQLSGPNASWSFMTGMVIAWGIIAPSLVKNGLAVGVQNFVDDGYPEIFNYQSMSKKYTTQTNPSPRYWLLWPGVLMMLTYSFADLGMNMFPIFMNMKKTGGFVPKINPNPRTWFQKRTNEIDPDDEDQTPYEDRVPTAWWTLGLAAATIMCCAILATKFHMNVGDAILSLILGFIFSFIAVQSSGTTDVNPVSTCAKASQLIFGGIGKGYNFSVSQAEIFNLSAGVIAAGSAAQSADMTGDLKTGYLLRAKPRNQFIAQLCGTTVATFLSVGLFILFTKATPCILYPTDEICTYAAPSISAWAAVAEAVASPSLPIPSSSGYTAIGFGIASVLIVVAKYLWVPKKYWVWVPNFNAVGLAFVVPQTYYAIAMVFGCTFNQIWLKKNPKSFDMYMFALSAGLLAGEGLGGVFQALLAVAGVDGGNFGTAIGCPANEFCG